MDYKLNPLFNSTSNFQITEEIHSITIFECEQKNPPLFTIAIPTFKRPKLLKQALESAINQTNSFCYDIIVVDNDSQRNCDTEQLVSQYKNYNLSYYKNSENLLMVGNWNRLYELAKGEFVVMLHDDDLLYSDYLSSIEKIGSLLEYNFDVLYTPWIIMDKMYEKHSSINNRNGFYIEKLKLKDFLWGNIIGPPVGMCLRKTKLLEIGGFDLKFHPSLDYAFYVKFSDKYRCLKLTGPPLWVYRIEDNESLKTETLVNFVKQDAFIKHLILKKLQPFTNIFWYNYFNVFVFKYLKMMKKLFINKEIDANRVLTELGFKYNFMSLIIYFTMNIFKKFYFRFRKKFLF